jgi:hypothetical protein
LFYNDKVTYDVLSDADGAFSRYYNNKEKIDLSIGTVDNSPACYMYYKDNVKFNLGITDKGNPFMNFFDDSKHSRINMFLSDYGKPSISLYDGNGNLRTKIGSTQTKNNKGQTINHPESSIWLFNESGNGIFQAPNE